MSTSFEDQMATLKTCVHAMLEATSAGQYGGMWNDVNLCHRYVLSMSAADLRFIRLHTGLITGEYVYQFWQKYPPVDPVPYAESVGYTQVVADLPGQLRIGEPRLQGLDVPLGVEFEGQQVNKDIARYQATVANLHHSGLLEAVRAGSRRRLVMEIGSGYGGLAHHLRRHVGNACIVLVDLPMTLMFAGAYLAANNPGRSFYVFDEKTFTPDFVAKELAGYDFALLPPHAIQQLDAAKAEVFLAINMMSLQEMTQAQVRGWIDFLGRRVTGAFYCNNIDRHPGNVHFTGGLTEELQRRFTLYPDPETFADPTLHADHPWYYRVSIGVPPAVPAPFPANAWIYVRQYTPQGGSSLDRHRTSWARRPLYSKNAGSVPA
jgi:hypothetical protein